MIGTIFRRRLIYILKRFKSHVLKLFYYLFCLYRCFSKDFYKSCRKINNWQHRGNKTKKSDNMDKPQLLELFSKSGTKKEKVKTNKKSTKFQVFFQKSTLERSQIPKKSGPRSSI